MDTIERSRPARLLDMGCGTGASLTRPLAERFPHVEIIAVDVDEASLAEARAEPVLGNLRFLAASTLNDDAVFDMVIASEVLEHVEDPSAFLERLVRATAKDGAILVTVPNGYGPFEWCAAFECLFNLSGAQGLLRRLFRRSDPAAVPPGAGTLAVSPHINFFSFRAVTRLFDEAGCRVARYRPGTFLCGYGLDSLIRGKRGIRWNARVADGLPAWCVSDWMFELRTGGEPRPPSWRRDPLSRFRMRLNQRRWGLA